MRMEELKNLIDRFNSGKISNYEDYVSILAVESVLKKKCLELENKRVEFAKHVSSLFKTPCSVSFGNGIIIRFKDSMFQNKDYSLSVYTYSDKPSIYSNGMNGNKYDYYCNLLKNDSEFLEFCSYFKSWVERYNKLRMNLYNNIGLYLYIYQTFDSTLRMLLTDYNYLAFEKPENDYKFPKEFYWYEVPSDIHHVPQGNFYYFKDVFGDKRELRFNNEEVKSIINEELIGKIYSLLRIDVSTFDNDLQEEFRQAELVGKTSLDEKKFEEINALKKLQVDRIMKAYALFKEAIELLNNTKMDMNFEKIKIDNLNQVIFKNGGLPNNYGYIEFEEFFKNNMVLRMLDLSELDLTNVDIRGIDFSGTNIHINPQVIYNKDMTGVNATDIKFSPFSDSFDGVIIDGTIINDYEANINLDTVRSYNEQTVIKKEVIDFITR